MLSTLRKWFSLEFRICTVLEIEEIEMENPIFIKRTVVTVILLRLT
jgi:hypothetical protein